MRLVLSPGIAHVSQVGTYWLSTLVDERPKTISLAAPIVPAILMKRVDPMVTFVHAVVSRASFAKRTHTKVPDAAMLEEGIVDDASNTPSIVLVRAGCQPSRHCARWRI